MHEQLRKLMARAGVFEQNDGNGNDLPGAGAAAAAASEAAQADAAKKAEAESQAAKEAEAQKKREQEAAGNKPSEEEARLLKEDMKRKEKVRELSAELEQVRGQLKQFEGIDPEAVRKLLADQKTAEEKQMEAKGEWDRLKARMSEEHSRTLSVKDAELQALREQLAAKDGVLNDMTIGSEFVNSEFINKELVLTPAKTRVVYGSYFELEEGKVIAYDKPRGAKDRTAIVDGFGNPLPFDAALRKIVDADPDKNHMLKSSVKPGASSANQPGARRPAQEEAKSSVAKISTGIASLLGGGGN